jgi:hypothetical protein
MRNLPSAKSNCNGKVREDQMSRVCSNIKRKKDTCPLLVGKARKTETTTRSRGGCMDYIDMYLGTIDGMVWTGLF